MHPCLLIELRPRGPLRFGPESGARDQTEVIFHSDTLFSAVTSAMARIGALNEWLVATASATLPEVRFSSCFPKSGNLRFVPPPRHLWPPAGATGKTRWKSARFVPADAIPALLRGDAFADESWAVDAASECLLPVDRNLSVPPFRIGLRTSSAVDRMGAGVEPHSTACLEFAPGAGLWCVVAFADAGAREVWKQRICGAFGVLADTGIGGERSRGWGAFDWSATDADDVGAVLGLAPNGSNGGERFWWLLSLFAPADEDRVNWQRGNYSLVERSGRIESAAAWGMPKQRMRMVEEGGVIACADEPLGSTRNVAPVEFPHPVYRFGVALAIEVPLRGQG